MTSTGTLNKTGPTQATLLGGLDAAGKIQAMELDTSGRFLSAGAVGVTGSANFTPAAAAYAAGDIISTAKEFTFTYSNGDAIPVGSLIRILTTIIKIDQTSIQANEAAYTLQCYSVTPPSAHADNDPWTLASGDLTAYRGAIALGAPLDLGAACYVKTPLVDLDIKLTAASLFAELVTVAGFTPTAVARQILLYGIIL